MVLSHHATLSACAAAALGFATGSALDAAAFWTAATLVDCDHIVDYWRDAGFNLDAPRFFSWFRLREPRYLLLALHAWEWPTALLALAWGAGAPDWVWAFGIGWLYHLSLDQRHNPHQASRCYFFAFRWSRGFRARDFYSDQGA